MPISTAFKTAIDTWASWVQKNINTNRTHVFFRTFEPSHWRYAFNVGNMMLCSQAFWHSSLLFGILLSVYKTMNEYFASCNLSVNLFTLNYVSGQRHYPFPLFLFEVANRVLEIFQNRSLDLSLGIVTSCN